jgi:hypothetical protein
MTDILQRVVNMLGDCAIGPMRTLKTDDLTSVLYDAYDEINRLRKALATYACRCGDGECYVDEFVASCGRSARVALEEGEKK